MKTEQTAIGVIYEYGHKGRLVSSLIGMDEIESFYNNNPGKVIKVLWGDGSESWAKAWQGGKCLRNGQLNPLYGKLVRIGAGAYGDVTIWKKETAK